MIEQGNEFNIVNEMYNEADWYRNKADRIEKAAQMIESDDDSFFDGDQGHGNRSDNERGNNSRFSGRGGNRGNMSGRGRSGYNADEVIVGSGGRGNRSFSDSNNADDERTEAGRMAHDADDFSDQELQDFLSNPDERDLNEDGETFDRRTKVGRALYAAGYIDDDGYPTDNHSGNRGNTNRSGSSRGRNFSNNNNRGNRNSSGNSGRGRSNTSNRGRSSGRSTSNR